MNILVANIVDIDVIIKLFYWFYYIVGIYFFVLVKFYFWIFIVSRVISHGYDL